MKKDLTALLAAILLLNGCSSPADNQTLATAVYPEEVPYPDIEAYDGTTDAFETAYDEWQSAKNSRRSDTSDTVTGMTPFVQKTAVRLLACEGDENRTYSPLNLYFALGMLAEITDGTSRTQVLDLMGATSTETLREDIAALWLSNYSDDGRVTSLLANSLWMSDLYTFRQPTLDLLAENHRASSYRGTMGDEAFSEQFRDWMNEHTGGLLEDSVKNLSFTEQNVLTLASTIYFKGRWQDEFSESMTAERVFHAPSGDVTVDFLNESSTASYYYGENFGAAAKRLDGSGKMWFILPDEGVTPEELLTDAEVTALYTGGETQSKRLVLNLSVPKFDVSSDLDLREALQTLGVTDVFDAETADFTPLTDDALFVSEAKHAARVMIDEEGCLAAAYTVMGLYGAAMPPEEEIDFVLDRPFLFVLTGEDGAVLFMGIVNQPGENS